MSTSFCDLYGSDEEELKFEGFRQDEVDQLEALLKADVYEESDDEEYEKIDTNQRSSKKFKRETLS